ncbi:MAG TPA: hypothetical protein VJN88_05800, partial [Ktedonobacterales bacterium]|nr:hypothetical protein [Ktedonobacterales bacterium]
MEPKPTYNSARAHDPERAVILRRPLHSGEASGRHPRAWESLRRWLVPDVGAREPDGGDDTPAARAWLRGYGAAVAGITAVSLVIA